MVDVLVGAVPLLCVVLGAVLLRALWRRVGEQKVSTARASVLSVLALLILVAIVALPTIVFESIAGRSSGYRVWAWAALATGTITTGVLLTLALVGDRSRGRRRCPKCWYDMSATPGLVCPECGGDARREGRLHLSRRRARWVAASLLPLAAGMLVYGAWLSQQSRWAQSVPTAVLSLASAWSDQSEELSWETLDRFGRPPGTPNAPAGWERWVQTQVSRLALRARSKPDVVLMHADLLAKLERDDRDVVARVTPLAGDADPRVARRAVALLAMMRADPEAREAALVGGTGHADVNARDRALWALRVHKSEHPGGAAPAAIVALAAGPPAQTPALGVLGLYDASEASRAALEGAMTHPDARTRAVAAAALASLYPDDSRVAALVLGELRAAAGADPEFHMLWELRRVDIAKARLGGEAAAAWRRVFTDDVRGAIVELATRIDDLETLGAWVGKHSAFTDEEKAAVKRAAGERQP
jgi:hypothetical protein